MPFRRTFRRRRRRTFRRRGRPMFGRGGGRMRVGRRPRRMVLDPERKFHELAVDTVAVTTAGQSALTNADIAHGLSEQQRIGNQILCVSLFTKYTMILGTSGEPSNVKIALVHMLQPGGVGITLNQVWTDLGTDGAIIGMRAINTAKRFKILWQRTHALTLETATVHNHMFSRLRLVTRYSAASGNVASLQSGALYLIFVSDRGAVADQPTIVIKTRLRYVG